MPLPNAWRLKNRETRRSVPRSPLPLTPPAVDPSEELAAVDEPQADLINVNEASKADLVSLPGIGPASADAIIRNRPYESVEEMIEKASLTRLDENDVAIITNSVSF